MDPDESKAKNGETAESEKQDGPLVSAARVIGSALGRVAGKLGAEAEKPAPPDEKPPKRAAKKKTSVKKPAAKKSAAKKKASKKAVARRKR